MIADLVVLLISSLVFVFHFSYCGVCIRRGIRQPANAVLISLLFIPLIVVSFGSVYRLFGLEDAVDRFDYVYFSAVTFTTLGYGDITPSGASRIVALVEALLGYLVTPIITGQILWQWSALPRKRKKK
ncbi:MAG: two pore domain potassium channel family protein [Sulfitobacter geojensis]